MKAINDLNFWKGFGLGIIILKLIEGTLALLMLIVVFLLGGS